MERHGGVRLLRLRPAQCLGSENGVLRGGRLHRQPLAAARRIRGVGRYAARRHTGRSGRRDRELGRVPQVADRRRDIQARNALPPSHTCLAGSCAPASYPAGATLSAWVSRSSTARDARRPRRRSSISSFPRRSRASACISAAAVPRRRRSAASDIAYIINPDDDRR